MPITHFDFISDQDLLADQRLAELESISWVTLQKKILKEVGKAKRVLEIGCGLGSFLYELNRVQNHQVFGLEPNLNAANIAQKKGILLKEKVSDFSPQFFDAVFCFSYLENIFDTKLFLREVLRVLKPNGRLYLSFQNLASIGNRVKLLGGHNPSGLGGYLEDSYGHRIRHYTHLKVLELLNGTVLEHSRFEVLSMNALPKKNNSILTYGLGLVAPSFSSHCLVTAMKRN